MARVHFESVAQYFEQVPEPAREMLELLRRTLREVVPDAEERISYNIPVLRYGGAPLVYLAGYAGHVAIYPATEGMIAATGERLTPHLTHKATIRFELNQPLPVELVRDLAAARVAEIDAKNTTKKAVSRRAPKATSPSAEASTTVVSEPSRGTHASRR